MYKFRPKRISLYPLVENPQKVQQGTYQAGGEFSSWLIDKQARSVFRVCMVSQIVDREQLILSP